MLMKQRNRIFLEWAAALPLLAGSGLAAAGASEPQAPQPAQAMQPAQPAQAAQAAQPAQPAQEAQASTTSGPSGAGMTSSSQSRSPELGAQAARSKGGRADDVRAEGRKALQDYRSTLQSDLDYSTR
jgi:hypothetical protein